ncbi:MAG TPA: SusD/RagB family nutrient-binding outer membrane lipoprotein, partial [Ferruginibacter sp.]|nr:SusD/RagB family nutrient-binding outer membrane lipoprotein [Ferruginibacter sp.]
NKQTNYSACATFNEKLNCIIRQRWCAFNTVTPFEAWGDYRRLFYMSPQLSAITDLPISVNPGRDANAIPIRILYPTVEYQTNPASVGAMGTIDHHASKVFWMN